MGIRSMRGDDLAVWAGLMLSGVAAGLSASGLSTEWIHALLVAAIASLIASQVLSRRARRHHAARQAARMSEIVHSISRCDELCSAPATGSREQFQRLQGSLEHSQGIVSGAASRLHENSGQDTLRAMVEQLQAIAADDGQAQRRADIEHFRAGYPDRILCNRHHGGKTRCRQHRHCRTLSGRARPARSGARADRPGERNQSPDFAARLERGDRSGARLRGGSGLLGGGRRGTQARAKYGIIQPRNRYAAQGCE